MPRKPNKWTEAVKGIAVEVRIDGWCWKAVVSHLGGGGTRYYRFNGAWRECFQSSVPPRAYRALRKDLRESIALATHHLRAEHATPARRAR